MKAGGESITVLLLKQFATDYQIHTIGAQRVVEQVLVKVIKQLQKIFAVYIE